MENKEIMVKMDFALSQTPEFLWRGISVVDKVDREEEVNLGSFRKSEHDWNKNVPLDPFSHSSTVFLSSQNQESVQSFPVDSVSTVELTPAVPIKECTASQLLKSAWSLDDNVAITSISKALEPTPINPFGKLTVVKKFDLAQCGSFHSTLPDGFVSELSKLLSAPNDFPQESTKDVFALPLSLQARGELTRVSSKMFASLSAKASESEDRHVSERWNDYYQQLKDFVQQHGHCHIPINCKEYSSLFAWAKRQRYQWKLKQEGKQSSMTDSHYALLEELGFVWDVRHTSWDSRYRELLEFRAIHGHCRVSINCKEFPKLGTWVKFQRRQYCLMKSGLKSHMTKTRVRQLNEIGFSWSGKQSGKLEHWKGFQPNDEHFDHS